MRIAQIHAAKLHPVLSADPRFAELELAPYTANDGSLMVSGMVQDEKDKERLMKLIEDSKPPVKGVYMVFTADKTLPVRSSSQ